MKKQFNPLDLYANFKAMPNDTLLAGTHQVRIDEFFLAKNEDSDAAKKERGYTDVTQRITCWFDNPEGRIPLTFNIGGFVRYKELLTDKPFWLSQVDPAMLKLSQKQWNKLIREDEAIAFDMAFTQASGYAVFRAHEGAFRITDEKRATDAMQILRRFVGAVLGSEYQIQGASGYEVVQELSKELVGKTLFITVVEDTDGNTEVSTRRGAFRKA